MTACRTEKDSMGEIEVPAHALYGAQTARGIQNFSIRIPLPRPFIDAVLLIKDAAARTNRELGLLKPEIADGICEAVQDLRTNWNGSHFPLSVYQTGSGTSTNMNVNEVIVGWLRNRGKNQGISPNDHVNLGQSSNDVIPTGIQVAAVRGLTEDLLPAIASLTGIIEETVTSHGELVKTGRTHLMDAVPIRFGDELAAWIAQLRESQERLRDCMVRLSQLPLGGTAVGTGLNCHPEFSVKAIARISEMTGCNFSPAESKCKNIASLDHLVECSGHLKSCGICLNKIAADLRWMNSGPLTGLGEIQLPPLQPGSSIMPAKVNPVIPEAVHMAVAQVIGHDTAITFCATQGNFQLNTMLPLAAFNLLESIELLSRSCHDLGEKAIRGMVIHRDRIEKSLQRNPILVTSLAPRIGYLKAAEIGKMAMEENRTVLEVTLRETEIPEDELRSLLSPENLASPHRQR